MSRIYATTDGDQKVLVWLECDLCNARIKLGKGIGESGWTKSGTKDELGRVISSYDYCPQHGGQQCREEDVGRWRS